MIAIVDSGVSNVRSVANMLRKAGAAAEITADPAVVAAADKVILPGIGAFDAGMRALRAGGLIDTLHATRARGTPVLGVCLGMQLMAAGSEEGSEPGLGWFDAEVVRFRFEDGDRRKVPHMGWNELRVARPSPLLDGVDSGARFYFVHSYYVRCRRPADVLATAHYGVDFAACVEQDNVYGVQFHPEKSHRFGLWLFSRFAAL